MRKLFLPLFCFSLFSCSPKIQQVLTKKISQAENELQHHIGFVVQDVSSNKIIFQHQADKYFTPASNTKVFTFYAALKILGDSLPALRYRETNDSLIFQGVGDPSFLNPFVFHSSRTFNFLRNNPRPLYLVSSQLKPERFGTGWAWDDYIGDYQPERNTFPIYSNLVKASYQPNQIKIYPNRFVSNFTIGSTKNELELKREEFANTFIIHPPKNGKNIEAYSPFIPNDTVVHQLLQDTLLRKIHFTTQDLNRRDKLLFAAPTDSILKVMMQDSDNFLAEQILMQCSFVISDSLLVEPAINFVQRNYLADLPDRLIWKDGSGLSRYNLATPRTILAIWQKILEEREIGYLEKLLPAGGESGTIKNWYKDDTPYIFAKTGTLANNHSLSGLLKTKSGKVLLFSYMNANYTNGATLVRKQMQTIFEYLRDHY